MPIALADWMSATFASQSTLEMGSSGLDVAQSTTMEMPTSVAGMDDGSLRSPVTVVAPHSRRKSAGTSRGRTRQRTS